jgi:hypothetical protein
VSELVLHFPLRKKVKKKKKAMSSDPAFPLRPRAFVEPILQEVARSLLEEKSALFASSPSSSSSSSSPPPLPLTPREGDSAAAAAADDPLPLLLRYPRDPRDADAFASELTGRLLARLAALGLPYKWAASCSLSARAGGGAAVAAAGVFEEEGGGEGGEGGGGGEGREPAATRRRCGGGDSVCSVQVEEGGVALTVTAAWVRCL